MNTRYFDKLSDVAEIKKLYRELAMQFHPDRGGDLRTMQEVNVQYHEALTRINGSKSVGDDGKERAYYYDAAVEQSIIDKISELIKAGVLDHAEVWLIGVYVWVIGDTKPIKDTLKKLGCYWHSARVCWYWKPDGYKSRRSRSSLDGLAVKYGATKVAETEETKRKTKGERIAA